MVGLDRLGLVRLDRCRGRRTSKLGGITILCRLSTSGRPTIPPDTIDSGHPTDFLSVIHAKSKRPTTQRLPVRICRKGFEKNRTIDGGRRIDYGSKDEESSQGYDGDSCYCHGSTFHDGGYSRVGYTPTRENGLAILVGFGRIHPPYDRLLACAW